MRNTVILVILAIILLTGIAAVLLMTKPRSDTTTNPNTNQANVATTNTNASDPAAAAITADEAAMRLTARNFAERYGSESTDNPGANLTLAASLAADPFANALRTLAQAAKPSATYHAILTSAFGVTVTTLTDAKASVEVICQRDETTGQTTTSKQATLRLNLVKQNANWLVSAANWK